MADSHIINPNRKSNFISGERTVNIFGKFSMEEMSDMLAELGYIIDNMTPTKPFTETDLFKDVAKLSSPYDLPKDSPVIDVRINSDGGEVRALCALTAELNRALARGAIIRTYVMGWAASCGSLLAIQGTPHFRIMACTSYHYIHFGRVSAAVTQESGEEVAYKKIQQHKQFIKDMYKEYTHLTNKEIKTFLDTEGKGTLPPNECLNKGICDWVQTSSGLYIKREQNTR